MVNKNLQERYDDRFVNLRGSRVEVKNNDINRAMRTLKKIMQSEGIIKELRERRFYEKPSVRRKKAKAAARKRWLKTLAKQEMDEQ